MQFFDEQKNNAAKMFSGRDYVATKLMDDIIEKRHKPEGIIQKYMTTIEWCKFTGSLSQTEDFMKTIAENPDGENIVRYLYNDFLFFSQFLPNAQCYEVTEDIFDFANDNFDENVPRETETPVPLDYNPCSDVMYISVEGVEDLDQSWIVVKDPQDKNLVRFGVCPSSMNRKTGSFPIISVGSWHLKQNKFTRSQVGEDTNYSNIIRAIFGIIQVINNPRFVLQQPAGKRQERRQAHRGMGKAVDAWHKISWDINKPVVAKMSRDETFHKMPLHYTRGHWRRAKDTDPKSVLRPNALNPEHRKIWWTWIEGFWSGHPAFGIKKSYHAPKMKAH
jgi:hypothetical protein